VAQAVKETRCRSIARGAEASGSCFPPSHTPSAELPAEDKLRERRTGEELRTRAAERDVQARGRAKGRLSCYSRAGLRKGMFFSKKRMQQLLQSWLSLASLRNAIHGACTNYLAISKRTSYFLKYFR